MSIIDTLITDRTQADVDALRALYAKPKAMWTAEEWNEFLLGNYRGAYNASDMNRVLDALDYLADRVTQFGYQKPEIKRPSITEVIPGTSKLPEGYTELEYIRSTGEQYTDTALKANQNYRVDIKYSTTATAGALIGADTSWGSNMFTIEFHFAAFGTSNYHYATVPSGKHTVSLNKGALSLDGTVLSTMAGTFTTPVNLTLFALNRNGKIQEYGTVELYSCQIYDNGTLVRDYVPCLNPSNEVGLYDIVNGVFYGNAGTGYFLPGPAVSLPEGYTRLENIESTGTEFVDTLFTPNQDTRIVLKYGGCNASEWREVFGAGVSVKNPSRNFVGVQHSSNGVMAELGTEYYTGPVTSDGAILDLNKNQFYVNGTLIKTFTYAAFTSPHTMRLFDAATDSEDYSRYAGKLYYCLIYNNDVLTRLYAPVLTEDGEIGLYDSITREFYGNAGTGVFVAGVELGSSDGNTPSQTIERDYYAIGDRPSESELRNYLDNVAAIRSVVELPSGTPEVPEDISKRILMEEANNIEIILAAVELLLNRIPLSWVYSGEFTAGEV